jgi:iron(III) transport system substrate-binding protein
MRANKLNQVLRSTLLWTTACLSFTTTVGAETKTLTVYSSRAEELIRPVFDLYEKETGIKITTVSDSEAALLQRIKAEGKRTKADLFITVDAGNLWLAAKEGILQKIDSKTATDNIPAHLRDPELQWFGLSVRARTLIYNPDKVKAAELSTYEDLAEPKWKGRLCLRTSKKVYNQSLTAMLMSVHGESEASRIISGWVKNLAAPVFASDNDVIKAVAAGQCDVGIANTYYFGRLGKQTPGMKAALFWPNQDSKTNPGVHVNISGAGVPKFAPNAAAGQKLLEWLTSPKAQEIFGSVNMEYPANAAVKPASDVAAWGEFRQSLINVAKAGEMQGEAIKLMDKVGWR